MTTCWCSLGLTGGGRPAQFPRRLKALAKRAGLSQIGMHDLRHSTAMVPLRQGVPAKIVIDLLGHSKITTTLDLYQHLDDTMREQASRALRDAIYDE